MYIHIYIIFIFVYMYTEGISEILGIAPKKVPAVHALHHLTLFTSIAINIQLLSQCFFNWLLIWDSGWSIFWTRPPGDPTRSP